MMLLVMDENKSARKVHNSAYSSMINAGKLDISTITSEIVGDQSFLGDHKNYKIDKPK